MHVTFMLSYFPNLSTKSLLHCDRIATAVILVILKQKGVMQTYRLADV